MKILVRIEVRDVDLIAGKSSVPICCLAGDGLAVEGERTACRLCSMHYLGYLGPYKVLLGRICLLSSYIVLWKVTGRIFSFWISSKNVGALQRVVFWKQAGRGSVVSSMFGLPCEG